MNSRRNLLVAVLAALAVTAGLVAAWRLRQPAPGPPAAASGGTGPGDTAGVERRIAEALGPAPVDSAEIRTGWRDDVPGVDLAAFDPTRREVFLRHANSRACTCGCGFTMAACRTYDPTCPESLPAVEALRDSVLRGLTTGARGLRERPRPAVGGNRGSG
jgi:hypothetical protein